jgi:hypothetical protein
MSYGMIAPCLGITLRAAGLAWSSWDRSRREVMSGLLLVLVSWLYLTTFLAPFERVAAYAGLLGAIGLAALTADTPRIESLPTA